MKKTQARVSLLLAVVLIFVFALSACSSKDKTPTSSTSVLEPINVLLVGDSITAATSYPELLQKMLGNQYNVINFGVSGTTLLKQGDRPYWNEQTFSLRTGVKADIVVIMLGTNDSKAQNWSFKNQFLSDYKDFIDQYKSLPKRPKIYLNTPPKVYLSGNYDITDEIVGKEIVPLVKQVAKETLLPLVNVYEATTNMPDNFPDNVHPNEEGSQVIANVVYTALTSQKAPKMDKRQ